MQKPLTRGNTKAKISNSITPDWLVSFYLTLKVKTVHSQAQAFLENTSLGCLLIQGMVLKATYNYKRLVLPFLSSRPSSAETFVQRKFKEVKSQPSDSTKNAASWPLVWLPEPAQPRAVAAVALAQGRGGDTSAQRVQATLLEALTPTLAAMMPHLWHLHKQWPHIQPLTSKQERTQKSNSWYPSRAAQIKETHWTTESPLIFWLFFLTEAYCFYIEVLKSRSFQTYFPK